MLRYLTFIFGFLLCVTISAFTSSVILNHEIRQSVGAAQTTTTYPFFNAMISKYSTTDQKISSSYSTSVSVLGMTADNDDDNHDASDVDGPPSGTVTRLAVRSFKSDGSNKPSSDDYTTKKDECSTVDITVEGVTDDYNNYRTLALNSTLDRAISIVTQNIYDDMRNVHGYPGLEIGELGENILVEGLTHTDMKVGTRCQIGDEVLVEITERIEPCGNLCKLSFINNEKLPKKLRMQRCVSFLKVLDEPEGYRGWYAKVIETGSIQTGDVMEILMDDDN
mmetsp:Transcript_14736/g.23037  ORF Transcript_14736/g.23037 Transcript_14736/m.23037 type:complete len:279 (+) Transcript_14736:48-884(+)